MRTVLPDLKKSLHSMVEQHCAIVLYRPLNTLYTALMMPIGITILLLINILASISIDLAMPIGIAMHFLAIGLVGIMIKLYKKKDKMYVLLFLVFLRLPLLKKHKHSFSLVLVRPWWSSGKALVKAW